MRRVSYIFMIITTLILASCQIPAADGAQTTATAVPSATPAGVLEVENASSSLSTDGYYRVVGLVTNHTAEAVTGVVLSMHILDAAGQTMLTDGRGGSLPSTSFSPLITTLAPGESAPFIYYARFNNVQPAEFFVTVESSIPVGLIRPSVQVEHTHMTLDATGDAHITGEVVNMDSQPIILMGLAGAVEDAEGHLIGAELAESFCTYLAASGDAGGLDRTPFAITIPLAGSSRTGLAVPLPGSTSAADFSIFPDQVSAAPVTNYGLQIEGVRGYFIQDGSLRIAGWLNNNAAQTASAILVGAAYAPTGAVLDASWAFSPVYLQSQAHLPFAISGFPILDSSTDLAAEVDAVTAQLDLGYSSSAGSIQLATLEPQILTVEQQAGVWRVNGTVTNASGSTLALVSALLWVEDADGTLYGVASTILTPTGDGFAPGEQVDFSLDLWLDPSGDPATLTLHTYVVGESR